jgi:hypothetical protein
VTFAAQRGFHARRPFGRNTVRPLASLEIAACAFAHWLGRLSLLGRRQPNSGAPRLRKSYRDSLFGRSRAVFTVTDMINLFSDEFSSLRGRSFALARVATRSFDGSFFRHVDPSRERLAIHGPSPASEREPA